MSTRTLYSGRSNRFRNNSRKYADRRRSGNQNYRNGSGRRSYGRGRYISKVIDPARYISRAVADSTCSIYDNTCAFDQFELHDILQSNIQKKKYQTPTKIQSQTIPSSLSGKDILGLASTGSGKTAAFLIPMINKSIQDVSQRCLIVTPTRELARQITDEFYGFSRGSDMKGVVVIGGSNMRRQIDGLKKNPPFVFGTPGRLIDLEKRRKIDLGSFNNIVLDEVDRMLDMGFVHDIKLIVSKLREDKQSLFFAATMTPKIEEIAQSFLKDPVRVQVEKISPQNTVDQDVVRVQPSKKFDELSVLLNNSEFKKVLIFLRTKWGSDKLSKHLALKGYNVDSIHGGKTQSCREKVISQFRQDQIRILVATDVVARGLDIDDITHVINYDEPGTYDDYIHRIGRTGRAGKKGTALTFVPA